jgi:hypothetical protein
MTARRIVWSVLLVALPVLCGCVRGRYVRASEGEPIPDVLLEPLRLDDSDLGDCLVALGAPSLVFPTESGSWIGMAWLWSDDAGFRINASYSAVRAGPSASFEFRNRDVDYRAVVLLLDDELRLRAIRRGFLSDILATSAGTRFTQIGVGIQRR